MTNMIVFPSKLTGETQSFKFDFLSRLAVGETISSAVVTATVFQGVDAAPAGIISGLASVDSGVVSQKITAGTAGVVYCLSCAATTSAGQELLINGLVAVLSTNPF